MPGLVATRKVTRSWPRAPKPSGCGSSEDPSFDLLEPAGLRFDPLGIAAQLAGELLQLDPQARGRTSELVELGVDTLPGCQRRLGRTHCLGCAALIAVAGERGKRLGGSAAQRL